MNKKTKVMATTVQTNWQPKRCPICEEVLSSKSSVFCIRCDEYCGEDIERLIPNRKCIECGKTNFDRYSSRCYLCS